MKLFIACELPPAARTALGELGAETTYEPGIVLDAAKARLTDVGVIVVGEQRVSRELLDRCKQLQMIIRAGEGPGEVSVEDASLQGVFVTHCPGVYSEAQAELAFGMILALDRAIVDHTLQLRSGTWDRVGAGAAHGLAGRKLGLMGFGADARAIARIARAFGMSVSAWSPSLPTRAEPNADIHLCNLAREVAETSDAICILPMPASEDLPVVDHAFLEALRPGAIVVNLAQTGVVDEAALARVARERGLRVGLDGVNDEPYIEQTTIDNNLLRLAGVVATPRIAELTRQAREAVGNEVVRIARDFLTSGEIRNCINLLDRSPATWQLVLRAKDQVGVLASILDAIRADGVNAEEIVSRVFTGAKAAWVAISLDERPSREALESIRKLPDVLHVELRAVV
ncbi:MAG: NAD(P)-dependent oxidoreductase [Phycisphaerae bacterium]|nr:NAD(P)-dependent oxidoreductase [Phycisphaerae bacterium]